MVLFYSLMFLTEKVDRTLPLLFLIHTDNTVQYTFVCDKCRIKYYFLAFFYVGGGGHVGYSPRSLQFQEKYQNVRK